MKRRKILWLIAFLAIGQVVFGQKSNSEPPKTRITVPDNLRTQLTISQSEIEKAQLQLQLAIVKRDNLVLNIRSALKVPSDYQGKVDENGSIYFEPPEPSPSPSKSKSHLCQNKPDLMSTLTGTSRRKRRAAFTMQVSSSSDNTDSSSAFPSSIISSCTACRSMMVLPFMLSYTFLSATLSMSAEVP